MPRSPGRCWNTSAGCSTTEAEPPPAARLPGRPYVGRLPRSAPAEDLDRHAMGELVGPGGVVARAAHADDAAQDRLVDDRGGSDHAVHGDQQHLPEMLCRICLETLGG